MRFSLSKTIIQENSKFSFNIKISEPGELVGEFVVGVNIIGSTKIQVTNLSPTPTPTPTPIPTPIPTPMPTNDIIYSFEDIPTTGDNLVNGVHGGIDFGIETWGAGNYFGFSSTSGWFYHNNSNSQNFIIPAGTRLKNIKLSTGVENSTWSISDNINPTINGFFTLVENPIMITTGWTNVGTNITITFSAGWDSGINDITYGN